MRSFAIAMLLLAGCGDDASPARSDAGTAQDAGVDAGADASASDGGRDAGAAPADAGASGPCTSFAAVEIRGTVESSELTEISGVVASRRQPGVLFVHNDSGESEARFFAIDDTGRHRGEISLDGASFSDWEDIAIGPRPGGGYDLYLGDTGDNAARESMGAMGRARITVYRVAEPDIPLDGEPVALTVEAFDTLRFVYPDHPHDSEAMFVDPESGDLYFITKEDDGMSTVFRAPAPIASGSDVTLEAVGEIAFGTEAAPGTPQSTAADIAPSGDAILVRTYASVLWWAHPSGVAIGETLALPAAQLPQAVEIQGEAIAFAHDARGYFTISEGRSARVHFHACAD
jgi:hypothetical protein